VSRVLNGGPVSEVLRRKVERAIDHLQYTPSVAARSLVNGCTGSIGVTVNSSQNPWFSQVLAGIEEVLIPTSKSVLLSSMMLSGRYDESTVMRWVQDRRVDGLILVRHSQRGEPLLHAAQDARLPVVLVAPDMDTPSAMNVRCNNLAAGRLATEHLIGLGHSRIAFAGGPQESMDTRMRLLGVEDTLRALDPAHSLADVWFGSGYVRSAGIEYAERFLRLLPGDRPTGVILANDSMALGFMRRVLSSGVAVPSAVSVVGFDGTPDGEQCWPGLTTVEQPTRQMAADACGTLLRRLESAVPIQLTTIEYPVSLLVRESTGPASRRARPNV